MLDIQNDIRIPTPLIEIYEPIFTQKKLKVFVKADFLTHPQLSGNKWRKLKYNLEAAANCGKNKLLSFGGAYSNHVYALGGVATNTPFEVNCIIRGEELNNTSNSTLKYAHDSGVKLHFVSRIDYRNKENLAAEFGQSYFVIPEGGTNNLALSGVSEVIDEINAVLKVDVIMAAMGTGGTIAGMLSNKNYRGKFIGIPVIKNGHWLETEVASLVDFDRKKLSIFSEFHGGGYGKITPELKFFAEGFYRKHHIKLDLIYTAKLFYAFYELVRNDYFAPNQQIVLYHSGGLRD